MNLTLPDLSDPATLTAMVNLLITVLPFFLGFVTFLGNRYVTSASTQRKLQALGSAASMAVDTVEQLEAQGAFRQFGVDQKGEAKRKEFYKVVRESLQKSGWTLKEGDAKATGILSDALDAELQKRYGLVLPVKKYGNAAVEALASVLDLQRTGRLKAPPDKDPRVFLVETAANHMITALAKESIAIAPELAIAWIDSTQLDRERGFNFPAAPAGSALVQLRALSVDAAEYLDRLLASGAPDIKLTEGELDSGQNLDQYLVTAWLFTKVAESRLSVTTTEINEAAMDALRRRQSGA